jgi:hypothetical protein
VIDNTSANLTGVGGRTIIQGNPLHWHEWIFQRPDGDWGDLISSGVGPVTILTRIMHYGVAMPAF